MSKSSLEFALLVESLDIVLNNDTRRGLPGLRSIPLEKLDWTLFASLALKHGVAALVAESLEYQSEEFPTDLAGALCAFRDKQRVYNETRSAVFRKHLDALYQSNIEVILFKGPVLAESTYGDIGLRVFWDFDFLFPVQQIQPMSEVLYDQGFIGNLPTTEKQIEAYWAYSGQAVFKHDKDELAIEPHWSLCPRTLGIDIDYQSMWDRSIERNWKGVRIRTFSPEDEFLMLALHGGKEAWFKLKYVADLAFFLKKNPDLDWGYVAAFSQKYGLLRIVQLALQVVDSTFSSSLIIPPEIMPNERDRTLKEVTERILNSGTSIAPEIYQVNSYFMQIRERKSDKIKYFLRTVMTPRRQHYGLLAIPDKFFFLYMPFKFLYSVFVNPLWKLWKLAAGK